MTGDWPFSALLPKTVRHHQPKRPQVSELLHGGEGGAGHLDRVSTRLHLGFSSRPFSSTPSNFRSPSAPSLQGGQQKQVAPGSPTHPQVPLKLPPDESL